MKTMTKPLASMTGYARTTGAAQGCTFQVEIKSVNARGLDLRLRLAPGLDVLEPDLRRHIGEVLTRGSVTVNISLQRDTAGSEVVINEQALGAVLDALDALSGRIEADRPRLDGVLALKGVLETRETSMTAEAEEQLHAAVIETVDTCLEDLVVSRKAEGDRLTNVLIARIEEIEALTKQAEEHPSRTRESILERLKQQIADLAGTDAGLSEERLHQEAMLLATKADIREELDRLTSHVKSARQLIAQGGPAGRKLDFLSQEFNREANTLCSKSNAVDLTSIGLDLKAAIDQLREQVQNIE
jgi:uncharacterized protein (TIGR00255 family)